MSTFNPYYKVIKDLKEVLQKYRYSIIEKLYSLVTDLPAGLTDTLIVEKYEEEFAEYSNDYTNTLKRFKKDLDEYLEKWKEVPKNIKELDPLGSRAGNIAIIRGYLEGFPSNYNSALYIQESLIRSVKAIEELIKEEMRYLINILEKMINDWDDIPNDPYRDTSTTPPITQSNQVSNTNPVEGKAVSITNTDPEKSGDRKKLVVQDIRVRKQYQSALSALETDPVASQAVSLDIDSATKQEALTDAANNAVLKLNAIVSELGRFLNAGSLADIPTDEQSSLFLRVLKKYGELRRNPKILPLNPLKYNEEYWREKIRAKYGGGLPFCDEVDSSGRPVTVRGHDGKIRFAKAEDVIETSDGEYVLKSDIDLDEVRKKLRPDKYDTY